MSKIIGIISWFDESPTWLASTTASMARICDHIIAVDGRYQLYDDERVCSEMVQHDAIQHTARGAGVGLTLHVPTEAYADEMAKRTHCFQLAQLVAESHRDWFFILDGDEVLIDAPPKDEMLAQLDHAASQGTRVITASLRDVADPHQNAERTAFGMKLPVATAIECWSPRLWRVGDNMRVIGYHYNYVCENEHGQTIELWGDDSLVPDRAPWGRIPQRLVIEHRHEQRALNRKNVRQQYYQDRNDTNLEPKLPLQQYEKVTT